jgi:hypothetical protein
MADGASDDDALLGVHPLPTPPRASPFSSAPAAKAVAATVPNASQKGLTGSLRLHCSNGLAQASRSPGPATACNGKHHERDAQRNGLSRRATAAATSAKVPCGGAADGSTRVRAAPQDQAVLRTACGTEPAPQRSAPVPRPRRAGMRAPPCVASSALAPPAQTQPARGTTGLQPAQRAPAADAAARRSSAAGLGDGALSVQPAVGAPASAAAARRSSAAVQAQAASQAAARALPHVSAQARLIPSTTAVALKRSAPHPIRRADFACPERNGVLTAAHGKPGHSFPPRQHALDRSDSSDDEVAIGTGIRTAIARPAKREASRGNETVLTAARHCSVEAPAPPVPPPSSQATATTCGDYASARAAEACQLSRRAAAGGGQEEQAAAAKSLRVDGAPAASMLRNRASGNNETSTMGLNAAACQAPAAGALAPQPRVRNAHAAALQASEPSEVLPAMQPAVPAKAAASPVLERQKAPAALQPESLAETAALQAVVTQQPPSALQSAAPASPTPLASPVAASGEACTFELPANTAFAEKPLTSQKTDKPAEGPANERGGSRDAADDAARQQPSPLQRSDPALAAAAPQLCSGKSSGHGAVASCTRPACRPRRASTASSTPAVECSPAARHASHCDLAELALLLASPVERIAAAPSAPPCLDSAAPPVRNGVTGGVAKRTPQRAKLKAPTPPPTAVRMTSRQLSAATAKEASIRASQAAVQRAADATTAKRRARSAGTEQSTAVAPKNGLRAALLAGSMPVAPQVALQTAEPRAQGVADEPMLRAKAQQSCRRSNHNGKASGLHTCSC